MESTRRSDIDALRAISVVSIIIFHLDKKFFPLGYLGVDIFFIISGFLISKIILRQFNNKNFSFMNFYLRRAKRILPALLFLFFVILCVSPLILLISDLKYLVLSLLSALFFVSNIYFWNTGGYFGTEDALKPLLHTWSLSIEEQFYLFFPLIFILILKYFSKTNIRLLIVFFITIFSFFLNIFFIEKGHHEVNFFLLPMRIWQFGIGVLAAFFIHFNFNEIKYKNLILNTAFFLIFLNFIYIIPGLPQATLLSIGCFLILVLQVGKESILYKFINLKIITTSGLISYSLYLWHWPIISFLKYSNFFKLEIIYIIVLFFTIYLISFFSWKYIERPFLNNKINYKKYTLITLVVIFLTSTSYIILKSNNFPSRFEDYPNNLSNAVGSTYHCSLFEYINFGDTYACSINKSVKSKPEVILFGNSHASMYGWGLKEILVEEKKRGLNVYLSDCLPTIDKNKNYKCLIKARKYFNAIVDKQEIKKIIIGLTWDTLNFIDENNVSYSGVEIRNQSIENLINQLKKNNKEVYLIGPIITPGYDLASLVSRDLAYINTNKENNTYKLSIPLKEFENKYLSDIFYFKKKLDDKLLLPHELLCDDDKCVFADKLGSNFSDSNHLSKYASTKMKKLFINLFK